MSVYSIKELEKLSGIKAHTIRIWEKRYNLIEPCRTSTNIRYYNDSDLRKILNVAMLNRHGVKISHIAKLGELELKEEVMRVSALHTSFDNIIDDMIVAMIDLDEPKFLNIISKNVSGYGLRDTVINLLYPFLDRVGILWQTGEINPFQEHFVSNLIRQKIISATDNLSSIFNARSTKFLLFLPEGEWHEIGLLFAQYLLREAGHDVIYLGQSVPYSDVLATVASNEFDYLLLSSTIVHKQADLTSYLNDLGIALPDKKIVFFSNLYEEITLNLSENHIHLKNLSDFISFLDTLKE